MDKIDESKAEIELTGTLYSSCLTCKKIYGSKPCIPELHNMLSHGYCEECDKVELDKTEPKGGVIV